MASSALSPEQFSSLPDLLPKPPAGAVKNGLKAANKVGGIPVPGGSPAASTSAGSGGLIDAAADANGVFKITSLAAAL